MPEELSRNCFDVILQHDWSIEQCLLHIRVFFGWKTKSPCFDLFTYWLMKQITNTVPKPFFRVIRKSLYPKYGLLKIFNVVMNLLGKSAARPPDDFDHFCPKLCLNCQSLFSNLVNMTTATIWPAKETNNA